MSAALALLLAAGPASAHDISVIMLDVGQGDGILIQDDQRNVLIDAGDAPTDVADQLAAMGVEKLSLVVATHPHADHIGGMKAVVDRFPIGNYLDNHQPHDTATYKALMGSIAAKLTTGMHYLEPGTDESKLTSARQFRLGPDATLTVVFPLDGERLTGTRSDLNSNSVVTRLDHGRDCFLFVGDAEAETERAILNDGQGQCDVLKVAHHGSEYATTPSFLAAVQPKVALVSVGEGNRYHHPGPHTMERLVSAGVHIYRTDLNGRITVHSSGNGIVVTTEREVEAPLLVEAPAEIAPVVHAPSGDAPMTAPGRPMAGALAARGPRPGAAADADMDRDDPPAADAGRGAAAPPDPPVAQGGARPLPAAALPTPPAPSPEALPDPAGGADASAADGPATPDAAVCPFPASRSSEVFHEDGCGNAERISPNNLVCYPTREAAIAAGKRPAGCCRP